MVKRISIVGGGPAGLFAALSAVQLGWEVVLYEKGRIGEGIKCAEGFLDSLKLLDQPQVGVRFPVRHMLVKLDDEYTLNLKGISLWMIDRQEWQIHLAQELLKRGVVIKEGTLIDQQLLSELQENSDWVIDASGVFSITSRKYAFSEFYRNNSAFTVQYVLQGDFSQLREKIKVGFEPHYLGYYWIFPKSDHEANVGVIWFDPKGVVKPPVGAIMELERIMRQEGIGQYILVKKMGGVCPTQVPDQLKYDNILLAGDSAGLTSPLHGGGLDLACISGKMAIDCIQQGRAELYREDLMALIGDKLEVEARLRQIWSELSFEEIDILLRMISLEWNSVNLRSLRKYPLRLVKEMGTILRFWRGMTTGDWKTKGLLGLGKFA